MSEFFNSIVALSRATTNMIVGMFNVLFVVEQIDTICASRAYVPYTTEWYYAYSSCLTSDPIGFVVGEPCYKTTCDVTISKHANVGAVLLVLIATVITFFYTWYRLIPRSHEPIGHNFISWYISVLMSRVQQPVPCTLRALFMKCPSVENYFASNHTHSSSAKLRNDAASFMSYFGSLVGRTPYMLQRSAADVRNGRAGCRTYHWGKDLTVAYSAFDPEPDDILCMVDCDMYMDVPYILCNHFQPVLIYTFQPSTVAHSDGDFSFTFNEKSEVTYSVSGGASYPHPVWDYGTDTLMATTREGMYYVHRSYNVDRRKVDDHHQLVLLTPIAQYYSPFFPLSRWIPDHHVQRLNITELMPDGRTYLRMSVQTKKGLLRSTGIANKYICANITAVEDDTLASQALIGKNVDLTPATVGMALRDVPHEAAVVLTQYHRQKVGKVCPIVYPIEYSTYRFQHYPKDYDPTAQPSLIPYMTPFALGCYAPEKCYNNDKAMVKGRVTDVKVADMHLTVSTATYMREFTEFLIPEKHIGVPETIDEVYARQNRPTQRVLLNVAAQSSAVSSERGVDSFMKKEGYEKPTDPRGISIIPGETKLNYSRFLYSYTKVLRATNWYAFGMSPLHTAQRVANICLEAETICNTDLSRFDGRVSNILRELEHMMMVRYFQKKYHQELNELMAKQQNQRARSSFGVKYNTGRARNSGSSETADFNSACNAYMAYETFRRQGMTPEQAWRKLGIYGGDDGVTPDVDPKLYKEVCASFGQILEVDEVKRGSRGVTFLARYYSPGVWHGAMDSICDISRQLTKYHTTVSLPSNVTALQKFAEKTYSYYLTDKNTPIIGNIATMFVEGFPELVPKQFELQEVAYKHSQCDESVQYPNVNCDGWMEAELQVSMPQFDMSLLDKWIKEVLATKSTVLLLGPPLMVPISKKHATKAEVVINGEVVRPPETKDNSPVKEELASATAPEEEKSNSPTKPRVEFTPEMLARMKTQPCRGFVTGKCKFGDKCRFKH